MRIGNRTQPFEWYHFRWPWVILSYLAKYSMTRSIARSLCDSWAVCSRNYARKQQGMFLIQRVQRYCDKTGSAAVISDCQIFFRFLPITYQIDIRTARFLGKFMTSDNGICSSVTPKLVEIKFLDVRWRLFSVRLEMCHWWTVFKRLTLL